MAMEMLFEGCCTMSSFINTPHHPPRSKEYVRIFKIPHLVVVVVVATIGEIKALPKLNLDIIAFGYGISILNK